ncbi:MAG: Zn-ribbon domain-containing OB-fold protein [Candidatus Thorarchaeota archaeon]
MEIQGSSCSKCTRTIVPERDTCPYCGPGNQMMPILLDNRGIILSYTVIEMPTKGFDPPVLLALVELDKGAVILALGEKSDIEHVKIDAPVLIHHDDKERFLLSAASR